MADQRKLIPNLYTASRPRGKEEALFMMIGSMLFMYVGGHESQRQTGQHH